MRSAVRLPLFLTVLLLNSANAWSAADANVRVEAMVGAAVVVFENIECPDTVYDVPTGEVAITDPETCETIVMLSTLPDDVGRLAWLIANNPDDLDSLADELAELSEGELAMLVTVLQNNQQHLGTNDDTVIDVVGKIAEVNPDAAATAVLTATVLNPGRTDDIVAAATNAAPAKAQDIRDAVDVSGNIQQQLNPGDKPAPGGGEVPPGGDGGGGPNVEVISITDTPAQPTSAPSNPGVPPGGQEPGDPSDEPPAEPPPPPSPE